VPQALFTINFRKKKAKPKTEQFLIGKSLQTLSLGTSTDQLPVENATRPRTEHSKMSASPKQSDSLRIHNLSAFIILMALGVKTELPT
jgi:hypothetical protein